MSSLRQALLASFGGKLAYAASSLVMLPMFANLLGAEALGLLGFFTMLSMALAVLDGGLTSAITRELASARTRCEWVSRRNLIYAFAVTNSYLVIFFLVGSVVALLVVMGANAISEKWLHFRELGSDEVVASIKLMGVFIGLNFPVLILQGALSGREMQVAMNALYIPYALIRNIGVLGVMRLNVLIGGEGNVETFFSLQVIVQLMYLAGLVLIAYQRGGSLGLRIRPRWRLVKRGLRFSVGVLAVSVSSVLVVQFDKMYLSGSMPLSQYGGYALASTIASIPYIFSAALSPVLFPRFSSRLRAGDLVGVERVFRSAFSCLSALLLVVCVVAWLFSLNGLRLIFDDALSREVERYVGFLMFGTALQSVLIVPYAVQLSAGWTKLAFRINLFAIPAIVVATIELVNIYGAVGATWVWAGYNLASFVITLYFVVGRFPHLRGSLLHALKVVSVVAVMAVPFFCYVSFFVAPSVPDLYVVMVVAGACFLLFSFAAVVFRNTLRGFA